MPRLLASYYTAMYAEEKASRQSRDHLAALRVRLEFTGNSQGCTVELSSILLARSYSSSSWLFSGLKRVHVPWLSVFSIEA